MKPRFDTVTFDCYGTLIDWQSGIADAFLGAAAKDGMALRRHEVLREYARIEPVVEGERYRLYRDVLTETAWRVANALGWQVSREHAAFLAGSIGDWKPFPDTNAALERLRASGLTLGILSNVDDELLAATRRHFTVPFDVIVTADQVRSYKPAPGHFRAARESIGSGARWLHAAQSNFHDIVPANAMGIPTAWVNRRGQRALPGGVPTVAEVRDLSELL